MADQQRRHGEAIAQLADRPADLEVVGQVVGEAREAADAREHLAAEGHGRTEARLGQLQPHAEGDAGQEVVVDGHGRQPRPQVSGRHADEGAGGEAHLRVGQSPGQAAQVAGRDADVAIGQHHDLVLGRPIHVDQVGDLQVGPVDSPVDHQLDVELGMGRDQGPHHRQGGVLAVTHAEHDLHRPRIVLAAEPLQAGAQARLVAMQRLEDGDGGKLEGAGRGAAQKPAQGQARGEGVQGAERGEGEQNPAENRHRFAHLILRRPQPYSLSGLISHWFHDTFIRHRPYPGAG